MPPLEPGNIDLHSRPRVHNADGSVSTVRSMSVGMDGGEVLLPTVSDDGRLLTNDEAVALYRQTGRHLGKFATPDEATSYAQGLHQDQEREYVGTEDGMSDTPNDVRYRLAERLKAAGAPNTTENLNRAMLQELGAPDAASPDIQAMVESAATGGRRATTRNSGGSGNRPGPLEPAPARVAGSGPAGTSAAPASARASADDLPLPPADPGPPPPRPGAPPSVPAVPAPTDAPNLGAPVQLGSGRLDSFLQSIVDAANPSAGPSGVTLGSGEGLPAPPPAPPPPAAPENVSPDELARLEGVDQPIRGTVSPLDAVGGVAGGARLIPALIRSLMPKPGPAMPPDLASAARPPNSGPVPSPAQASAARPPLSIPPGHGTAPLPPGLAPTPTQASAMMPPAAPSAMSQALASAARPPTGPSVPGVQQATAPVPPGMMPPPPPSPSNIGMPRVRSDPTAARPPVGGGSPPPSLATAPRPPVVGAGSPSPSQAVSPLPPSQGPARASVLPPRNPTLQEATAPLPTPKPTAEQTMAPIPPGAQAGAQAAETAAAPMTETIRKITTMLQRRGMPLGQAVEQARREVTRLGRGS